MNFQECRASPFLALVASLPLCLGRWCRRCGCHQRGFGPWTLCFTLALGPCGPLWHPWLFLSLCWCLSKRGSHFFSDQNVFHIGPDLCRTSNPRRASCSGSTTPILSPPTSCPSLGIDPVPHSLAYSQHQDKSWHQPLLKHSPYSWSWPNFLLLLSALAPTQALVPIVSLNNTKTTKNRHEKKNIKNYINNF